MINLTSPAYRDVLDKFVVPTLYETELFNLRFWCGAWENLRGVGINQEETNVEVGGAEGQNRNGLDTALCTDPEHGSQWCVSDCFPFAW